MTKVAVQAERLNHHPDWKNVYNTVDIVLNTHEVKGITTKDLHLAILIDFIYQGKKVDEQNEELKRELKEI